jgi:hypothetical protein
MLKKFYGNHLDRVHHGFLNDFQRPLFVKWSVSHKNPIGAALESFENIPVRLFSCNNFKMNKRAG